MVAVIERHGSLLQLWMVREKDELRGKREKFLKNMIIDEQLIEFRLITERLKRGVLSETVKKKLVRKAQHPKLLP